MAKDDLTTVEAHAADVSTPSGIPMMDDPVHSKTEEVVSEVRESSDDADDKAHVTGWKLYMLTAGIWLALFLSTLETTIVSTSLVSITNALHGFYHRDWIVTSYLLTYTGFLVIFAKLGDVFGRKTMYLLGLILFTFFSIACGVSNSMTEIIIFRAVQGIGASGIYSMTMVIAPTLVPKEKFGKYIAIVSTVFALASVLGPILGGTISSASASSWRWVFLLNAPAGCLAVLLLGLCLPSSLTTPNPSTLISHFRSKFTQHNLRRIDLLGVVLLLAASVLIVFALEEGGSRYSWGSGPIIASFTLAGTLAICFVCWQLYLSRTITRVEAVFPPRIVQSRLPAAMMMTAFFIGFPFVAIVVNYPQRAQAVAGLSPEKAGISLLPLLLTSPLATAASGFLTSNINVPPCYVIVVGSVLQLIGVGLSCTLPTNVHEVTAKQYGFEAIMGVGFGLVLSTVLILAPLIVTQKDLAVTMGALTQIRVLGGTISLAICSTIFNNHVHPALSDILSPVQLAALADNLSAIKSLDPEQQLVVRRIFAEGYNKQNIFLAAFSGIGLVSSLFLWEKNPRRVRPVAPQTSQ